MMVKDLTKNRVLFEKVFISQTFFSRAKGLIGKKQMENNEAMWIKPCNGVHTYFMKFSLDVLFLDKNMQVCAIEKKVKPFRFSKIYFKAKSVLEINSGLSDEKQIKIGDYLYVGT